ncbi:hypothetical protein PO002_05165 [Cupriavidus necator]|uniref:hypothetical protein n=1 Tax=Cupriavidus necator TaxID=106590 RepID=UPI0039C1C7C5
MNRSTLARTAGILGGRDDFRRFLADRYAQAWTQNGDLPDTDRAAAVIRAVCGIESRSELDSDPAAAHRYHTRIGLAFSTWRAGMTPGASNRT